MSEDSVSSQSGGVNVESESTHVGNDLVGRDQIVSQTTNNYFGQEPPTTAQLLKWLPGYERKPLIGREEEIQKICEMIDSGHYPIIVIHGIGGVGKSALAFEVAWQYAAKQAVLWAFVRRDELTIEGHVRRQHSLQPIDSIYKDIAEALDLQNIMKTDPELRQGLVIKALKRQQKILLVIDNLDTPDYEVLDFLQELRGRAVTLVTSRSHIDQPGLELKPLTESDSYRLIEKTCGPELVEILNEADKRRICEQTGRVPAALVCCASLIKVYGHSIDKVLSRVTKPMGGYARFWFEAARQHILHQPAEDLLMALALFSTSAEKSAVVTVAGFDDWGDRDDALDDSLGLLERLSLINKRWDRDNKNYRYDLLPLTKEFALAHLRSKSEQYQSEAARRYIDYFTGLRDRSRDDKIGWTIFTDYRPERNRREYRPDIDNITKAIDLALADEKNNYWRQAADILDNFRASLFAYGLWGERMSFCIQIIARAEAANDRVIAARVQRLLAWMHCFRGEFERARQIAYEALENALTGESIQDYQTRYKAHNTLGQIARLEGNYQLARRELQEARQIVADKYRAEVFIIEYHLGEVEYEEGKYEAEQLEALEAAERHFAEAKQIFEAVLKTAEAQDPPHDRAICHAHYYLGKLSRRKWTEEGYQRAEQHFAIGQSIADKFGDKIIGARFRLGFAKVEAARGHVQVAQRLAYGAHKQFEDLGVDEKLLLDMRGFLNKLETHPEGVPLTAK